MIILLSGMITREAIENQGKLRKPKTKPRKIILVFGMIPLKTRMIIQKTVIILVSRTGLHFRSLNESEKIEK